MTKKILALGDCNTEGDKYNKNNSYPEKLANKLNLSCINCGYTMSTTREMLNFYKEYIDNDIQIILIQYGLVDSWKTFKYAPYVLYYPDTFFRKIGRKIIKKYKKIARNLGLLDKLGSEYLVSQDEYEKNIEYIIKNSANKKIVLIDTVPNKDISRNSSIIEYNQILTNLSKKYTNCIKVDLYDESLKNIENFYLDDTHINQIGYEFMVDKIMKKLT